MIHVKVVKPRQRDNILCLIYFTIEPTKKCVEYFIEKNSSG